MLCRIEEKYYIDVEFLQEGGKEIQINFLYLSDEGVVKMDRGERNEKRKDRKLKFLNPV